MQFASTSKFKESIVVRCFSILPVEDKRKLILVIFVQIISGLLDLLGVMFFGLLGALAVNGISSQSPSSRVIKVLTFFGIQNQSLQYQSMVLSIIAATLLIIKTLFSVYFIRKTTFYLARRSAAISSDLIRKVLAQPLLKLQDKSIQETLFLVTSGVEAIIVGILSACVMIISDLSLLLILGLGLFVVDPTVAISSFSFFASIAWFLHRLLQVRAVYLGKENTRVTILNSEKIVEVLNSYREIIVKNRSNYYAKEISKLRFRLADLSAESNFMPNISKYVIEISMVLGAILLSALQFSINTASHAVAVLSVFLAASTRVSPAILRLQHGAIAIKTRIGSALPTLNMLEELKGASPLSEKIDALDLEHVGFDPVLEMHEVQMSYKSRNQFAIKDVNLRIHSGKMTAFVGPSGAGKTTLIDLMLGVLEPQKGKITINGINPIEAIKKWPGAIGYLPQDAVIFNSTIKENVCLGFNAEEIEDEMIWEALEVAQLKEEVMKMPSGINTLVGDKGSRISGGQRQRLAIARTFFTKPKLIFFDEATSALDGSTEANFTEAIQNLKGKVTIVVIAHRLSTVMNSDKIYYIEDGKIKGAGNFNELRQQIPDFDKQARLMGL